MRQKLKIFLAYSEVAPFTRINSVSDAGGALPKYLKEQGHDVRVITPQYRSINERRYILRDVIRLQDIKIPLGDEVVTVNVKSAFMPHSKVQVYFLDYRPFFFRTGVYNDPETGLPYTDNALRFILFSKGILETLKKLQWQPDVIHCNDWQTALIPFLLNTQYKDDVFFQPVSSLLTVHHINQPGLFDNSCSDALNMDDSGKQLVTERHGKISFLESGLSQANGINTVNQSVYDSIGECEQTDTALGLLKSRIEHVINIDNGVDDTIWVPEQNPHLTTAFSAENPENKKENKRALMEMAGLPDQQKTPLILIPAWYFNGKEPKTLLALFDEILQQDVMLILLTGGNQVLNQTIEAFQKEHASQVAVVETHERNLHQCVAGADACLCLFQEEETFSWVRHGLRYGTLPVVSEIPGMEDLIQPCDEKNGDGCGILFQGHSLKAVGKAVKTLCRVLTSANADSFIHNAMVQSFSWTESVLKYWDMYETCLVENKR